MREQEEMAKAALRSRMPAMRGTRGGWGTRGTPSIDIYQEINNQEPEELIEPRINP